MAPRHRPSAFEVSFPDEVRDVVMGDPEDSGQSRQFHLNNGSGSAGSASTTLGKRRSEGLGDVRSAKRRQLPEGTNTAAPQSLQRN